MRRFGAVLAGALTLAGAAWAQQAVSPENLRKAKETLPPPVSNRVSRPVSHHTVAAVALSTPSPSTPDRTSSLAAVSAPAVEAIPTPNPVAQAGVPAPQSGALPIVIGARIGEHPEGTRFVIEVSDPLKLRVFTLANPNRVVIDMPEVLWRLNNADKPNGQGAVKSYRYGLFRPGDSRFVIDLNSPVSAAQPMILPPENGYGYRVVLDLAPTTQAFFEKSAGWPADLRAKEKAVELVASVPPPGLVPALKPALPNGETPIRRKVIVIDPGHGGIDSGTLAADGSMEKNLVLDEGKRLARALQARGYIVHMTRDTDIYIPLRERVSIGRGYGADLFISLHADSNPDTTVNGASVYTLSESGSDKEAAALAKKENQSDIIAGVDLTGQDDAVSHILIDLAQRDTINRSVRFAETVVAKLGPATDILPREPHRSAAFAVLKAPDVPAVLIELGYLSNDRDAAQMATPDWRDGVANAIAGAVDKQFGQAPALPAGAVASQQGAE
jgi:N-acetylmuramoyl-L-alanine amidase